MVFGTRLISLGLLVAALLALNGCRSNGNTIIEPDRSKAEHSDVVAATAQYATEKQEMISQRD